MPALEGFADVGQRLSAVRRRLNVFVLLDAVCGTLAIVGLVGTAVVAVGLWGSPRAFRLTVGAAVLTTAATLAGAALHTRRRWVDLLGAARLADRRGDLSDRLTTLATVPADPHPSPLALLLVEQTLNLDTRWRPEVVVPVRVPRTAVALVAVLLVLGAMVVLLRTQPFASFTQNRHAGPPPGLPAQAAAGERPPPARSLPSGVRPIAPDTANASESTRSDAPEPAGEDADAAGNDPGTAPNPLVALPAQLQHAIRAAVRGESAGEAKALATASQHREDGPDGDAGKDAGDDPSARGRGTPGTKEDVAARKGKDARDQPQGDAGEQQSGATSRSADARPTRDRHPGHDGDDPPPSGAAPPAGPGSSAGNLLGATPGGTAPGDPGAGTFKVTITSFLKALDQPPTTQRAGSRRSGASTAPRTAPSLSDTQLADDLLRKAEVPPEYEELVRRVFSTREEP